MRAVTRSEYGEPDVIQVRDIPRPEPAAHEILVRVHATTVNRTDCAILRAKPAVMRFTTGCGGPGQRSSEPTSPVRWSAPDRV